MTISTRGNHLKSCNNNQPLHHEKTAPRPARPPTATHRKTDLPLKKGTLQEEMLGVAQFWESVSHLYFFLWSAPTHHPTQPFRFSVCLHGRSVFLAQKSFFGSGSFLTMSCLEKIVIERSRTTPEKVPTTAVVEGSLLRWF